MQDEQQETWRGPVPLPNPLDVARLGEIYSRTAAFYDEIVAQKQAAAKLAAIESLARRPGERFVEVGVGTAWAFGRPAWSSTPGPRLTRYPGKANAPCRCARLTGPSRPTRGRSTRRRGTSGSLKRCRQGCSTLGFPAWADVRIRFAFPGLPEGAVLQGGEARDAQEGHRLARRLTAK